MAPPTRRDFLRDSALLTAATTLPWLSACGRSDGVDAIASPVDPVGTSPFNHGVASGDPLTDRVILWTRVTPVADSPVADSPIDVAWAIGTDPNLDQVLLAGTTTADATRDYTVKLDPEGLAPDTTYYYQFAALGFASPIGRTRTLPVAGVERLRMAFTSCSQYATGFFTVYRAMAQRADLDLVLHLGDYIYENGGQGSVGRGHRPERETLSLEDYRTRYAQHRGDADLQEAHRQHPWVCVWDDHESANDSWKDGASSHNEGEGDWSTRKNISTRVYDEWMPIRTQDPTDLSRIYRRFVYGDLVDLIVWETRLFGRDQQAASMTESQVINDPMRTMMGFEQEAWLAARLAESTARWRVYANQTMFAQLNVLNSPVDNDLISLPLNVPANPDQWDGYAANRDRIFQMWEALGLRNNVVITGDIHTSWANELSPAPGDLTQYNPVNGTGSFGVEFITPSVTSSGLPELNGIADVVRVVNTHIKYVDTAAHGYVVLDITPERCQGEFWYVDTITEPMATESFATAFATQDAAASGGWNALAAVSEPSAPRPDAPPLAPETDTAVLGLAI